jgi:hypothetical protein
MLSKLKKKLKPQQPGNKRKPERSGADAGGERVDSTGSLPRPEPHVLSGGDHDQEGSGVNVVEGHVFSTNRPSQPDEPEPVPVRGSEDDREGREGDVDAHPDVEAEREGNGADGKKVEQVHPSPSTPSLVRGGRPDGMLTRLF